MLFNKIPNNCWNMFNDKSIVEGVHTRLGDCHPIRSVNDSYFM